MRAQPKLVAGNAVEFSEDHAHMLGARRRFHIQQLLYCLAVAQPIRDRGYVIHAVHIRIEHRISAVLADLLDAAVQISNYAFEAKNLFAVKPQNHAQHAVGRRMLRAHIDDEFVGIKKRLLGSFQIEMRERAVLFRHSLLLALHWPLSMPRLICTHSLSCCRMP